MKQRGSTVNPAAATSTATSAVEPDASANEPANEPTNEPADARRARWRRHRADRRAALVDAAIRAIHREGTAVGMEDIAREARVSKPVLYRYFADKAELYLAVGQRAAEALLRTLRAELEHEREPRAHLAAVIDAYLAAIEAQPQLYRFVTRRSFADRPVERDLVGDYTGLIAAHVSRVIGDRAAGAGPEPIPAEAWGHGVVGLVQAAGDWWLEHRSVRRADLTEHLTTLVWSGLGSALST